MTVVLGDFRFNQLLYRLTGAQESKVGFSIHYQIVNGGLHSVTSVDVFVSHVTCTIIANICVAAPSPFDGV